jgi:hypothetical protein
VGGFHSVVIFHRMAQIIKKRGCSDLMRGKKLYGEKSEQKNCYSPIASLVPKHPTPQKNAVTTQDSSIVIAVYLKVCIYRRGENTYLQAWA